MHQLYAPSTVTTVEPANGGNIVVGNHPRTPKGRDSISNEFVIRWPVGVEIKMSSCFEIWWVEVDELTFCPSPAADKLQRI